MTLGIRRPSRPIRTPPTHSVNPVKDWARIPKGMTGEQVERPLGTDSPLPLQVTTHSVPERAVRPGAARLHTSIARRRSAKRPGPWCSGYCHTSSERKRGLRARAGYRALQRRTDRSSSLVSGRLFPYLSKRTWKRGWERRGSQRVSSRSRWTLKKLGPSRSCSISSIAASTSPALARIRARSVAA